MDCKDSPSTLALCSVRHWVIEPIKESHAQRGLWSSLRSREKNEALVPKNCLKSDGLNPSRSNFDPSSNKEGRVPTLINFFLTKWKSKGKAASELRIQSTLNSKWDNASSS